MRTRVVNLETENGQLKKRVKTLEDQVQTLEDQVQILEDQVKTLVKREERREGLIMLGEMVQSVEAHLTLLFVKKPTKPGKKLRRQPYKSILNGDMLDGKKKVAFDAALKGIS